MCEKMKSSASIFRDMRTANFLHL
jgi:hypothetical protein